jgi:hypothetical protein
MSPLCGRPARVRVSRPESRWWSLATPPAVSTWACDDLPFLAERPLGVGALARGQGRYDHEKWARQQAREDERRQRAEVAAEKAAERERKAAEVAAGRAEAERLSTEVTERVARLGSILPSGLDRPARVDLAALRRRDVLPPLDLRDRATAPPRPQWEDFAPAEPGTFAGLFGGKGRAMSGVWPRRTWSSNEPGATTTGPR